MVFHTGKGCDAFDHGYNPSKPPPAGNTAPKAKASATPSSALVGQAVRLSASGSTDTETPNNLTCSWDYGDGGTTKDATGQTVNHAFGRAGTYPATVTVSDPQGLTSKATAVVTVTGGGGAVVTDDRTVVPAREPSPCP